MGAKRKGRPGTFWRSNDLRCLGFVLRLTQAFDFDGWTQELWPCADAGGVGMGWMPSNSPNHIPNLSYGEQDALEDVPK